MSVRVVRRQKELDKVHAAHRIRDGVRIVAELGQLLANELLVVGLLLGFGRHGRSRGEPAVANGVHRKKPVRRGRESKPAVVCRFRRQKPRPGVVPRAFRPTLPPSTAGDRSLLDFFHGCDRYRIRPNAKWRVPPSRCLPCMARLLAALLHHPVSCACMMLPVAGRSSSLVQCTTIPIPFQWSRVLCALPPGNTDFTQPRSSYVHRAGTAHQRLSGATNAFSAFRLISACCLRMNFRWRGRLQWILDCRT